MALTFSTLYKTLSTPEPNGLKIGTFRWLCAVFGGLLAAYSGMTLIVFLIPSKVDHAAIVPFLFTPFVWSCMALWITLSPTKLYALLRALIPSVISCLGILVFLLGSR